MYKRYFLFQGKYILDLNTTDIVRKFHGNSYYYGNFLYKITILSKNHNIICITFGAVVTREGIKK
jgi:hypothetical protein